MAIDPDVDRGQHMQKGGAPLSTSDKWSFFNMHEIAVVGRDRWDLGS